MFKKSKLVFGLTLLAIALVLVLAGPAFAAQPSGTPPDCPDSNPACHPPINVSGSSQTKEGGLITKTFFLAWKYVLSPIFRVSHSSLVTGDLHRSTAVRSIIAGGGAENNGTDNFLHIFGLAQTSTGNHVTGQLDRWTKIWDNLAVPGEIKASNYYICPTPDSCSLINNSGGGFWAAAIDPTDKRIHNTNGDGIIVNNGTTITANTISFPASSGVIGTNQARPLGLKTGGINKIYITSGGNIGIGNNLSSPTFKLQIDGHTGPHADNVYNLGSPTKRWANLYASNINICTASGTCSPITGGSKWTQGTDDNIYRTSSVGIGGDPANPDDGASSMGTFRLQVAGNVGPQTDNYYHLGSSGKKWANLYATDVHATNLYATNICTSPGVNCTSVADLGGEPDPFMYRCVYQVSSVNDHTTMFELKYGPKRYCASVSPFYAHVESNTTSFYTSRVANNPLTGWRGIASFDRSNDSASLQCYWNLDEGATYTPISGGVQAPKGQRIEKNGASTVQQNIWTVNTQDLMSEIDVTCLNDKLIID